MPGSREKFSKRLRKLLALDAVIDGQSSDAKISFAKMLRKKSDPQRLSIKTDFTHTGQKVLPMTHLVESGYQLDYLAMLLCAGSRLESATLAIAVDYASRRKSQFYLSVAHLLYFFAMQQKVAIEPRLSQHPLVLELKRAYQPIAVALQQQQHQKAGVAINQYFASPRELVIWGYWLALNQLAKLSVEQLQKINDTVFIDTLSLMKPYLACELMQAFDPDASVRLEALLAHAKCPANKKSRRRPPPVETKRENFFTAKTASPNDQSRSPRSAAFTITITSDDTTRPLLWKPGRDDSAADTGDNLVSTASSCEIKCS